jgi:adenylate cyclase
MAEEGVQRRLAAILAADVAGYSRLMGADEEGTLKTLNLYRGVVIQLVEEHQGRIVATAGDSLLAEFGSAVQAVRSAVAVQRALDRRNADLEEARRMHFRIGINVGDVMVQGTDLLGDGVNIAARLEQMAEPGSILVSGTVWEQIEGKLSFPCSYAGEQTAKNITRPVRTYRVAWEQPEILAASLGGPPSAPALPDKPSIAVLPFFNMGSDVEQEYFADGISEDIITALSHYRWFFVIARNSTFAYKGRSVDVKQVARELGVRYVLEGSVRKAGGRIRATAQLIEAETGNHIWAERFDRDVTDIFALQDEITQSVVAAIEPELQSVEGKRAARKSASANLDSFDCCMRGIWHFNQFTLEDSSQAESWLRRAIQADPTFAQAHMMLARLLSTRIWWGWSQNFDQDLTDGYLAAAHAATLDERDPYSQYALFLFSVLTRRHDQALTQAQRSIDLSSNFSLGYFALGWIRIYIGHFPEAIDPILRSHRLNPNDPQSGAHLAIVGLAYYHQRDYETALRYAERGPRRRRHPLVLRTLLASLGQLGRIEEARGILQELEQSGTTARPRYWEITNPYLHDSHLAHLREGVVKAGLHV